MRTFIARADIALERYLRWSAAGFAAIVSFALLYLVLLSVRTGLSDWLATSYYFTYGTEFLKRALIGHALSVLSPDHVVEAAVRLSYAVLGLLYLIFVLSWRRVIENTTLAAVFLALLLSSATFQHLWHDFGRFDAYLFLLLVANVAISARLGPVFAAIAILSVQSTAILIHEGALLITAPLAIAAFLFFHPRSLLLALGVGSALLAFFVFVQVAGQSDLNSFEVFLTDIRSKFPAAVPVSVAVLFRDLDESVGYALANGLTPLRLFGLVVLLVALFNLVFLFWVLLGSALRTRSLFTVLMLLSCLTPLLLYPAGHDHFRWWSAAFANFSIVVTVLVLVKPQFVTDAVSGCAHAKTVLVLGAVLSLLLGPVGVTVPFGPEIGGLFSVQ